MHLVISLLKIAVLGTSLALSGAPAMAQIGGDEFLPPSNENPLPVKLRCEVKNTPEKLQLTFEPAKGNLVKIQSFVGNATVGTTVTEEAAYDDTASDTLYLIQHFEKTDNQNVFIVSTFMTARIWPGGRRINPGKMAIQEVTVKINPETGEEEFDVKDFVDADLKCAAFE
jgi:hypothetical protein